MKIKVEELKTLLVQILSSKNYSQEEAEKIAEVLLYAELAGKNTQGILKLFGTEPAQDIKPQYAAKITKETDLSAVIDGGGAAGPLSAQLGADKVIEIAEEKGFGIVGVNNIFSSIGAIGFYVRKMAKRDLIGVVAANSPRSVAPAGGISPAYGTNPIAFGFPTLTHPIVFDMAASAITWYGLVRAKALGEKLPDNVAMDSEGNITTDPEAAMKGALLPFDRSHKGSGLAMVVELLAGSLTGASVVFDEGQWGATFIAISPELLIGTEKFKQSSSELVEKVKAGKAKPGAELRIPGFDAEERLKDEEIEIADEFIQQLKGKIV